MYAHSYIYIYRERRAHKKRNNGGVYYKRKRQNDLFTPVISLSLGEIYDRVYLYNDNSVL